MAWGKTIIDVRGSRAVSCIETIKKSARACLLLLLGSSLGFAQSSTHRCEVAIIDNNTDTMSKLGSFTTVVESEKLITKAFRFPGTELFVNTSVLYMQESPFIKGAPPSEMILTLLLGKKAYSEIETEMKNAEMITNAKAIVPLKSFQRAQVATIFLGQRQPVIITLECKK